MCQISTLATSAFSAELYMKTASSSLLSGICCLTSNNIRRKPYGKYYQFCLHKTIVCVWSVYRCVSSDMLCTCGGQFCGPGPLLPPLRDNSFFPLSHLADVYVKFHNLQSRPESHLLKFQTCLSELKPS